MFSLTHFAGTEMLLLSLPRQPRQNETATFYTSKPRPVLGLKPKPVLTNGIRPNCIEVSCSLIDVRYSLLIFLVFCRTVALNKGE